MRMEGQKFRMRVRTRQKTVLRVAIIAATGTGLIAFVAFLYFNFTRVKVGVSAERHVQIKQFNEQVFTNEMSLPSPVINELNPQSDKVIFIQRMKPVQEK